MMVPCLNAFDFSSSPFDGLDADEQRMVRDAVDIAYFREGETILDPGIEASHLFVIIKGHVSQFDAGEIVATYGPHDSASTAARSSPAARAAASSRPRRCSPMSSRRGRSTR